MIMIRAAGETKMALSFETSLGLFHSDAEAAAQVVGAAASTACAQPAPFLTKTYELVDDPATNHIVSWNEDDTSFVVWRPPEFAKDILPKYFKHNNFSSFIRQLNTYGFRKVVPERWEFANDCFRRGETHLLCEIHRRKPSSHAAYNRSSPPTSAADVAPSEDQHHLHQLTWLHNMPSNSADSNIQGAHVNMSANHNFSHNYNSYGCTNAVYNLGGPDRSTSSEMSGGSSRHLDQSGRASLHDSAASAVVSDENERLRRDNTLLLYELSRLRHLCRSAVLAFQHRAAANPGLPPGFPPSNPIPPPVAATPLSHLFPQPVNRPALLPPSDHVSALPAATSAHAPRAQRYDDGDEGHVSMRRHASLSNLGLLYGDSNINSPARLLTHNNASTTNIIRLDDCKSILHRPAADRLQQCEQAGVVKLFGVPLSSVDHDITNLEGSTSSSTSIRPSSF